MRTTVIAQSDHCTVLEGQYASLFSPKNSFQFYPAKFENFRTEIFSSLKNVLVAQRSLLVRNYFKFLVQQRFSNSNLRQMSDYKSISVIIKSNIASIQSFFSNFHSKLKTSYQKTSYYAFFSKAFWPNAFQAGPLFLLIICTKLRQSHKSGA